MRPTGLLAALAASLATSAAAIPTISTKGSKFFTSDGNQWFVKGVAYQRSPDDPLLDTAQCQLDAKQMKDLGANAIRVYHVDGTGDHSGCMQAFADNGIYLFVDMDTFSTYITQEDPHWNETQLHAFQAVMDEFHSFDNTAGFFVGNEVLTNGTHSEVAVLVKAATRDLKSYRNSKGYRNIPVGYSHADISTLRPNLQNYLACGTNATESIDFFGLNAYEWCGANTYQGSGYKALTAQVVNYPVPIFFSETGCQTARPRTFQDQTAIFGSDMSPYWSGAIIYEWIQEANAYGLITYGGNTDAAVTPAATATIPILGTPTPLSPDYSNLKAVWATVSPDSVKEAAYSPTITPPACPAYTPGVWQVNGNARLPAVGATIDAQASSSINAGKSTHQQEGSGKASSSSILSVTPSQKITAQGIGAVSTATPASPSSSMAAASPGKEITGASAGLLGVMLGFILWL